MKGYWVVLDNTEDTYNTFATQAEAETDAEICAKNKPGQSFDVAEVKKRFIGEVVVNQQVRP